MLGKSVKQVNMTTYAKSFMEVGMRYLPMLRIVLSIILMISYAALVAQPATKVVNQEDYDLQLVKEKVKNNQPQLTKIYTRESAVYAQGGMLKITLYITEKGKVADVEIKVAAGKFTSTLIKAMKAKILGWKFANKTKLIYTYSLRLSKS